MSDLSPNPITIISIIHLLVSPFFFLVPSHSCDLLEDPLPSLSQYGSVSAPPDDEDLEFDDSTSGFTFIIGEFLCFSSQFHSLFDILMSYFHVLLQHIYSHGKDCTGSFVIR